MVIQLLRVSIPAMSTIGYGTGLDDDGRIVKFVGDHRPMRDLGEAMKYASIHDPIMVDLDDWQVCA